MCSSEDRETKKNMGKKMTKKRGGGLARLCVNNGLHHQKARRKGKGMIASNHPSVSFLSSLALLAPFVAIHQTLSPLASSISPLLTLYFLPAPLETYFCPAGGGLSFVMYRRGTRGGMMKMEAVCGAEVNEGLGQTEEIKRK